MNDRACRRSRSLLPSESLFVAGSDTTTYQNRWHRTYVTSRFFPKAICNKGLGASSGNLIDDVTSFAPRLDFWIFLEGLTDRTKYKVA